MATPTPTFLLREKIADDGNDVTKSGTIFFHRCYPPALDNNSSIAVISQGQTSHKFYDASANPVMRIYYTSRPVLFFMCAGNEVFYASLYLLHFTEGPLYVFYVTAVLCFPVAVAKLAIALLQVRGKKWAMEVVFCLEIFIELLLVIR